MQNDKTKCNYFSVLLAICIKYNLSMFETICFDAIITGGGAGGGDSDKWSLPSEWNSLSSKLDASFCGPKKLFVFL